VILTTALIVASVLGIALGWTVRNATDSTQRRVIEELYSRKLRLADQQRDEAVKTLNVNRVEMAGFAARFEALDSQISGLRESLDSTERARAKAVESLAARESEIAACREAGDEGKRASEQARALVEAAHLRVSSAEGAMDQAYDELMSQAETLAATAQSLTESNARAGELEAELGRRDLALADRSEAVARLGDEFLRVNEECARRGTEIVELNELAAGLAPLRAELAERDARLERFAETQQQHLARIQELTPLADAFPGLRAECDSMSLNNRELELQLALVVAEAAKLPPLREEYAALSLRADSTASELDRERQLREQVTATSLAHEADARNSRQEISRLEQELQQLGARADSTAKELERERQLREQHSAASHAHADEARSSKREVARLEKELGQSQARTESGAKELERARQRIENLNAAGATREEEARAAKREFARIEQELQASLISLESRRREIEKKNARIATLEDQLDERDSRIKALAPVSRAQAARVVLRPQPSKRPVPTSATDDLKRIAGIGPVLAKKLRRLGVASFDQLAALTRADIEMLAEKLGVAADRIRREGWISAARVEARSRNGS
jgi:predicted flap endonuclease-1-like 5' DNA nuclease